MSSTEPSEKEVIDLSQKRLGDPSDECCEKKLKPDLQNAPVIDQKTSCMICLDSDYLCFVKYRKWCMCALHICANCAETEKIDKCPLCTIKLGTFAYDLDYISANQLDTRYGEYMCKRCNESLPRTEYMKHLKKCRYHKCENCKTNEKISHFIECECGKSICKKLKLSHVLTHKSYNLCAVCLQLDVNHMQSVMCGCGKSLNFCQGMITSFNHFNGQCPLIIRNQEKKLIEREIKQVYQIMNCGECRRPQQMQGLGFNSKCVDHEMVRLINTMGSIDLAKNRIQLIMPQLIAMNNKWTEMEM